MVLCLWAYFIGILVKKLVKKSSILCTYISRYISVKVNECTHSQTILEGFLDIYDRPFYEKYVSIKSIFMKLVVVWQIYAKTSKINRQRNQSKSNLLLRDEATQVLFYNVYSKNCPIVRYKNIYNHTTSFLQVSSLFDHHQGSILCRIPPWWLP